MRKIAPLFIVVAASLCTASAVHAAAASHFNFKDTSGKLQSVPVISKYYPKKIEYPAAKLDRHLDPKLMQAATIAQERANAHSRSLCWRYVKQALVASGAVNSYPKSAYAKDAGQELVQNY